MHKREENIKEMAPFLESVKTMKKVMRKTPGKDKKKGHDAKEEKYEQMPISMAHGKKEEKSEEILITQKNM